MAHRGYANVEVFHDLHRWFSMQADEIEALKMRQQRLNTRRKEGIAGLANQLQRDVTERKKEVNDFSLELEQYTLRKFDLLTDDVAAARQDKKVDEAEDASDEYLRKQRQITSLCVDIDILHDAMINVSDAMQDFANGFCGKGESERANGGGREAGQNGDELDTGARVGQLTQAQVDEDLRLRSNVRSGLPQQAP